MASLKVLINYRCSVGRSETHRFKNRLLPRLDTALLILVAIRLRVPRHAVATSPDEAKPNPGLLCCARETRIALRSIRATLATSRRAVIEIFNAEDTDAFCVVLPRQPNGEIRKELHAGTLMLECRARSNPAAVQHARYPAPDHLYVRR